MASRKKSRKPTMKGACIEKFEFPRHRQLLSSWRSEPIIFEISRRCRAGCLSDNSRKGEATTRRKTFTLKKTGSAGASAPNSARRALRAWCSCVPISQQCGRWGFTAARGHPHQDSCTGELRQGVRNGGAPAGQRLQATLSPDEQVGVEQQNLCLSLRCPSAVFVADPVLAVVVAVVAPPSRGKRWKPASGRRISAFAIERPLDRRPRRDEAINLARVSIFMQRYRFRATRG